MVQFPALRDYILQGRAQQTEMNKKFKKIWMLLDVSTCCTVYETCMMFDDEYLSMGMYLMNFCLCV
jgi:hypothetical protein